MVLSNDVVVGVALGFAGCGIWNGASLKRPARKCCWRGAQSVVMSGKGGGRFARPKSLKDEDKEKRRQERLAGTLKYPLRAERWQRKQRVTRESQYEEVALIPPAREEDRVFRDIRNALRNGNQQEAWDIYKHLQKVPSKNLYNRLLSIFGRYASFQAAEKVYTDMTAHVKPDVATFNTILHLQAQEGEYEMVRHTFNMLRLNEPEFVPTVHTYTILINTCGLAGDLDGAEELMHDMKRGEMPLSPNLSTFNGLLSAYARKGDAERARFCVARLQRAGLQPDHVTYTTLMLMYLKLYDLKNARKMYSKVLREEWPPNVVTYTALVKYCSAVEDFDGVEAIFWKIVAHKLSLDDVAQRAIVKALEKGRRKEALVEMTSHFGRRPVRKPVREEEEIRSVLERSLSWSPPRPVVETAESIRRVLATGEDHTKFVAVFNKLLRKYANQSMRALFHVYDVMKEVPLAPTVATFTILMGAFARRGEVEIVERIFAEMKALDIPADRTAWSVLIGSHLQSGDAAEAERTLQDMLRAGCRASSTEFGIVARAHAIHSKEEDVENTVRQMSEQKIKPDTIFLNGVLDAYARKPALAKATRFMNAMIALGVEPDIVTHNTIIKLHCRRGCLKDAESVLLSLRRPDLVSFNTIISAFSRRGDVRNALRLLASLRKQSSRRLHPDLLTYKPIFHALANARNCVEASSVYSLMRQDGVEPDANLSRIFSQLSLPRLEPNLPPQKRGH